MNDNLEQRLRAALASVSEQPPAGLLAAVARRHRRHQIRMGAAALAVAAALALAVPQAAGALRGGSGPAGQGPGTSAPGHILAAPGTVLSGCQRSNIGQISRNWRAGAIAHAGPVWFIGGGNSAGRLRLYVAIVVLRQMRPGSVAVARVAPAGRGSLRFLYGPDDFGHSGRTYTMRDGKPGVTFVACRPDQETFPARGLTDYYGGYLVRGGACVPVRIWLPGKASPALIRLGACARR